MYLCTRTFCDTIIMGIFPFPCFFCETERHFIRPWFNSLTKMGQVIATKLFTPTQAVLWCCDNRRLLQAPKCFVSY